MPFFGRLGRTLEDRRFAGCFGSLLKEEQKKKETSFGFPPTNGADLRGRFGGTFLRKKLDEQGIEPWASRMRNGRSTTELHAHDYRYFGFPKTNLNTEQNIKN